MFHLADHARDLDAIANCDRTFEQDNKAADKITGDILQAEADPDSDGPREDGKRRVDAGIFENDKNPDDENGVRDHLGKRILKRTIQAAMGGRLKRKRFVFDEIKRPG